MAEESKVPNVKDGLASGVQTMGGVPVLVKEVVPVDDTGAGQDIDAGMEKERVMAAFRSGKPEETGPEERSGSETRGLATGVQTVGGTPVLQKEVASMEKPDDSAVGAKEKERVLTAFYSDTPEHTGLEKGSETAEGTGALATGIQTVGGVPVLKKEVAGIDKPEDSAVGAKEKERVLAAFHSKEPSETTPAAESAPATIGEQGAEPSPKASKKGTIAALKDKVALAFKTEAKPAEEEKVTVEKDGEKPGAPSLKDRVYQSVGSLGDRVKSQATSLRTSWKSENKVGTEAKEVDAEGVKPVSEPAPGDAEKVEAETPAVSLESPGKEKTTVKERVIQRVGSLSEKVKLQASAMKSAWKPEDKKGADADSPKPAVSETSPKPSAEESVATYEHGKGRITVFSISGCPHCKAAKALLKKKKVKFAEINLDVFPERREEMQERTGKSSCPQIFFNDKLIGGNDSLQALENEGKLDAELQVVHDTAVPPSAPALAGAGKSEPSFGDQKPDEHLDLVKLLRERLAVKDRWFKLRKYDRCFVGSEAVDLVVEEKKLSRPEAAALLQQLQAKHFFHHVLREQSFKDGAFFYRFLEHEPFVKSAANWSGATSDSEPLPAVDLGNGLRKLILAVYDEFLSDDGRHVDYQGIAKSEIFRRYVKKTLELQRVDVSTLTREEKLAFFINIYNALVIHVTAVLGHGPTTLAVRRHFFTEHTYIIGGSSYSLTAIENGILRGNKRPPFFFSKPFGEKDDRLPVALTTSEPLIHFALVCGAKSCPPVKTYEPKTVDESLKAAAQGFFEGGGIEIDAESKTIHLSKILSWYKSDFGSTDLEVLKFVARFLTLKEREKLEALISEGKYKIEYQPYDWSANSTE